MASILKQNRKDEEEVTSSTLIENRRSTRKLFKRQPADTSRSNESRRSASKTLRHPDSIDSKGPSYIRVPLELLPSMTEIQQTIPLSLNQQSNRLSHLGKKPSANSNSGCLNILQKRVENLESQVNLKNQQIQMLEEEKQKLRIDLIELETKYKHLDESSKTTNQQKETLKQQLRKLNIDNKKLEQDKQALNKKISFLEKVQFTSDTKNIQTLRETHLEGELELIKNKLKQSKSQVESLLESQLLEMREELFTAKKLIESLQISNDCLQKKIDSASYLINQEDNYTALKSKYRKFLTEFKDLKKSYDILQKENKIMKTQIKRSTTHEDLSLELSMFSIMT